jgi:hypothetical protein
LPANWKKQPSDGSKGLGLFSEKKSLPSRKTIAGNGMGVSGQRHPASKPQLLRMPGLLELALF